MSALEPFTINTKNFLRKHSSLPALPEILNQIREKMYAKDASINRLSGLISKDASLVAQILKIVNSAYYSLPIEISDVRHAVAYLGMNEIHRIILSLSVINILSIEDKPDFDDIWFHSLLSALCTKYIAQKFEPRFNINELWSAALLHDIGKLVYLKFFTDHFKALRKYSQKNGCLFTEAENHYSFPKSSQIGSLLCEQWRLPDQINDACTYHSLIDLEKMNKGESFSPNVRVVVLGNLIAVLAQNKLNKKMKETVINNIEGAMKKSNCLCGYKYFLREF